MSTTLLSGGRAIALASDDQAPSVTTTVLIPEAPAIVFALATNASQWPRWHPATAAVRETPDRPLVEGDSVVESIRAAGRSFDARWVVVACDAPRRWVIATDSAKGCAWIEYSLTSRTGVTRFTRRLRWRSHGAFWAWCDRGLTRWMLERQSRRALANLAALFSTKEPTP